MITALMPPCPTPPWRYPNTLVGRTGRRRRSNAVKARSQTGGFWILFGRVYETAERFSASLMPGGDRGGAGMRPRSRSTTTETPGNPPNGRDSGSSPSSTKPRALSLPRIPRRPWRVGFEQLAWRPADRAYAAVLEALTRERTALLEQGRELAAPARPRTTGAISPEQERQARAELALFRAALEDARTRSGPRGDLEVPFDSQHPRDDASADMLIQYLVRPGYAEVRTEETEPWQYRYWIRVGWDRLRQLAAQTGHRLPL
jgi:hypothetical protein